MGNTGLEIVELRVEPSLIPLHSPFETAKRRQTVAENALVKVVLANGLTGYGEASPAHYVTGETLDSVLSTGETAAAALRGIRADQVERWSAALHEALPHACTARSAVEMALLDAMTLSWKVPLWVYFGGATTEVRTDLTIPISTAEQAAETAGKAGRDGFRSLKIKVGGPDREDDFARALAVSQAAPGAAIRLDANQAFHPDEAVAFVRRCLDAGIPVEMMEQPVPADDLEALAACTRQCPVSVIADEAVVDARAALRVAAMGAAHGINIKVAKAGLIGARQIIAIARAAGLKLMLGCMMESLPGIGASIHLACGTGAFDFLDLDSHMLIGLTADGRTFSQEGDLLRVDDQRAGLGWEPS